MAKTEIERVIEENSILAWANSHRKIRTDGEWRDYNISDYPYLLDVFRSLQNPNTEQLTLQWATQTGKTEAVLSSVFYYMVTRGQNALFMLPHASALRDMAHSRIDPILENSPWLKKYFSDISNVRLKTSNQGGSLYLRGAAGSEAQLEEFPAGMAVFDEASRFKDPSKIELAQKRLGSTENPWIVFLGHPLYEGCRISTEFANSSRYEWAYKCPNCGEINVPVDFFDNYYERDRTLGCRSCSQDWSKSDVIQDGLWKAQGDPGNPNQGFHLSRMIAPTQDLDKMADAYEKAKAQGGTKQAVFFQTYLGKPFSASGDKISEKQVRDLMTGPSMATAEAEETVMGVDTGKPLYYTILKGDRILSVGKAKTFDRLHTVRDRHNATLVALDAMPETHATKEFINELPSDVKGLMIRTKGSGKIEEPAVKRDQKEVTAHSVWMWDELFNRINSRELTFPEDLPVEAIKHFTAPVRVIEDNEVTYQKGEAHIADSTKFAVVAQSLLGEKLPTAKQEGVFNMFNPESHILTEERCPKPRNWWAGVSIERNSGAYLLGGTSPIMKKEITGGSWEESNKQQLLIVREWVQPGSTSYPVLRHFEKLMEFLSEANFDYNGTNSPLKPKYTMTNSKNLSELAREKRKNTFLRVYKSEPNFDRTFEKIRNLLGHDKLKLHESCEKLAKTLETAKWSEIEGDPQLKALALLVDGLYHARSAIFKSWEG